MINNRSCSHRAGAGLDNNNIDELSGIKALHSASGYIYNRLYDQCELGHGLG